MFLIANGGLVASSGPAARSSRRLVAPTRLSPRMYTQPESARLPLQVTTLSPTCRHNRRRRTLIANKTLLLSLPSRFYSPVPQRHTWPASPRWTLVFGLPLYRARACAYLACASCFPLQAASKTRGRLVIPPDHRLVRNYSPSDVLSAPSHVLARPFGNGA